MNGRRLALGAALAGAAWLAFFGDKAPVAVVEPAAPAAARRPVRPIRPVPDAVAPRQTEGTILALQPRATLIGGAHAGGLSGKFFAAHSWAPVAQPVPAAPPAAPAPAIAPPAPPAPPPLPFRYLGQRVDDGGREIYLAQGERSITVREHSVIDGAYRVDAIAGNQLTLTYMPLNQTQTLTIGAPN